MRSASPPIPARRRAPGARVAISLSLRRLAVLCLAALAFAGLAGAETLRGEPTVVEGDLLAFGETLVQLHAVDAPELAQTCRRDGLPWACGREARDALARLIDGREVRCEVRDHNALGRPIGLCRTGERDLSEAMVASGMALANHFYAPDYVPAQREAREAERGIWKAEFIRPWAWRRGQRMEPEGGPGAVGGNG